MLHPCLGPLWGNTLTSVKGQVPARGGRDGLQCSGLECQVALLALATSLTCPGAPRGGTPRTGSLSQPNNNSWRWPQLPGYF